MGSREAELSLTHGELLCTYSQGLFSPHNLTNNEKILHILAALDLSFLHSFLTAQPPHAAVSLVLQDLHGSSHLKCTFSLQELLILQLPPWGL